MNRRLKRSCTLYSSASQGHGEKLCRSSVGPHEEGYPEAFSQGLSGFMTQDSPGSFY
jgi:hypothetical protein